MRKGLTIVEVVVLLILGLMLLGLILMGLQQLRERGGLAQCRNNLRLIGEAIHHQKEKEKEIKELPLPAARIADGYATWPVQLVPYLAAGSPLKDWDLRKPYHAQEAQIREAILPMFFCPARNRMKFLSKDDGTADNPLPGALGDYACASGDGDVRFPWDSARANGAIILGEVLKRKGALILHWQPRTSFTTLKRGLSNTILAGEKHVPLGGFGLVAFGDGSFYNGTNPAGSARVGGPGFGLAHDLTDPMNNNFGSYHPGVCQFLMADGAVQANHNDIDEEILGQLIRRE